MNKVALLREATGGTRRVTALPPWLGPAKGGTYWHQPRSAAVYVDRNGERLVVSLWCGQSRHLRSSLDGRFTDAPPDDLKCGTCAGRREGHAREDGLVFAPRDPFALPHWCPGSSGPTPYHRTCFACGSPTRASTRWDRGEAQHRPLPDLLVRCSPCPRHGWREVVERDGRLVCVSWRGGEDGRCLFECGPR